MLILAAAAITALSTHMEAVHRAAFHKRVLSASRCVVAHFMCATFFVGEIKMSTITLEIKDLEKQYFKKPVLKNINLSATSTGTIGLIGENGAGKTTLLKVLAGIIRPTSGTITVNGTDLNKISPHVVSYMPDSSCLFTDLTGLDNIKIRCYEWDTNPSIGKLLLNKVGLNNASNLKVKKYSFGMKRRLDFAISLLGKPSVILLDEPFNGLDPAGVTDLCRLITEQSSQSLILISSHNLQEVSELCTRIVMISNGSVVHDSSQLSNSDVNVYKISFNENDFDLALKLINLNNDVEVRRIESISIYIEFKSGTINNLLDYLSKGGVFPSSFSSLKTDAREIFYAHRRED